MNGNGWKVKSSIRYTIVRSRVRSTRLEVQG